MFLYLFLTASSFAIATADMPSKENTNTPQEQQELQEIITLFTQAENNAESTLNSVAPATEKTVTAATAPIKITNAIEPSMLAYKHWTGTYSPEKFTIKVNGTEVAQGASYELNSTDAPLEISYAFSFMNGMRTGTKTVAYKLNENSSQANITFSWKDNWKVLIDNGTAVKEVTT